MNMDVNRRVTALRAGRQSRLLSNSGSTGCIRVWTRRISLFVIWAIWRFEEVSTRWGFDVRAVSQGMCLG